MIYVATARGFIIVNYGEGDQKKYSFAPDPRYATPFESFDDADETAKACVMVCLPRKQHYYSILDTCNGKLFKDEQVDHDLAMTETGLFPRLSNAVKNLIGAS